MSRNTGILSDSDREFLLGQLEFEGEHADQKETQKRYRLRKKLVNAINDFTLIHGHLDDHDKEMVFENADINGIDTALEFLYGGIRDHDNLAHGEILKDAVAEVEDRHSPPGTVVDRVDFTMSFTETDPDIDLLRERLEEGEPLTDSEVGSLVRVGALSPEDLEKVTWQREEWDIEEIEWTRSDSLHPRED